MQTCGEAISWLVRCDKGGEGSSNGWKDSNGPSAFSSSRRCSMQQTSLLWRCAQVCYCDRHVIYNMQMLHCSHIRRPLADQRPICMTVPVALCTFTQHQDEGSPGQGDSQSGSAISIKGSTVGKHKGQPHGQHSRHIDGQPDGRHDGQGTGQATVQHNEQTLSQGRDSMTVCKTPGKTTGRDIKKDNRQNNGQKQWAETMAGQQAETMGRNIKKDNRQNNGQK